MPDWMRQLPPEGATGAVPADLAQAVSPSQRVH
jgi:hypothetical protein